MSEETKTDGVQTQNQDGVKVEENKVAYETFSRALDEKKRVQSENEKLQRELESIRSQQAEKSGNLEEALQSYKEQLSQRDQELQGLKKTFVTEKVHSKIERALVDRGCKDPMGAIKLMDDKDYNAIVSDVDEGFNIGEHTLNYTLDKLRKEKEYLFGKKKPVIVDGLPVSGVAEKPKSRAAILKEKMINSKTKEEYMQYEKEYIALLK